MMWDEKKCNEWLAIGQLQSCNERYGWARLAAWEANRKQVFSGSSDVSCMVDFKSSSFCKVNKSFPLISFHLIAHAAV